MKIFKNEEAKKNNAANTVKDLLLNNIIEGLIAVDENGNVIYSNSLGKAIMEEGLFGPIDIVSHNPKEINYNGKIYRAKYDKLNEESGLKGTIATLEDILGESMVAKEVKELTEKLERANSFKAAFFANMSHEIRTPIHAIIGSSEIMLKNDISKENKEQIDLIKDSSYSLLAIINDVLDLSKIEAGKMELVLSNYFISYVIRDIEATYSLLASRKNLKFEMHLDNNIPSNLNGDKIRLRGVLINILNNAIKFTKEGKIDFFIRVLEKKGGMVTLQFEIKDTGIGIKKEDMERIFDSFARFDINNNYSVEGRGLGLAIAKGYIDLMGGTIEVKSEYGVGSSFIVTVNQKIVDDSPVDMSIVNARKNKNNEKFTIRDYKVLVADDNPINLTVADGLVKSYGLSADKASGGAQAINMCMATKYDIIFMDQMMPEVDGIQAMRQIRKISDYYEKECKIIVLTADAMAGVRDRLINEGFDEYLCKPLEIHRLEALFRKIVPQDHIVIEGEDPSDDIVIEESKAQVEVPKEVKKDEKEDISKIAANLLVSEEILERKIKDCGGSLDDYRAICEIATNHAPNKISKLRESQSTGDYDRYTIEVHALKTSVASMGAAFIADMARDHENAGKNQDHQYIDDNVETLITEYQGFIDRVKKHVLGIDDSEEVAKASGSGEEWTKEEIRQVCIKIISLIEEYSFAEIFDILEKVEKMEKGPKTKAIFDKLKKSMNDMDIDALRKQLGELT
ncbi:MAG: ATP-binding protein [Lachnospiraceae bacterium]|nr:ATP-binding protein [Lachnospiraceae bacterium]